MSGPPRTPDGHHVVIDGRRWRASDPGIPEALRQALVNELMAARRAVGAATDEDAEAHARARVHDAKVALGERGEPWWEPPTDDGLAERVAASARALLRARDPDSSICPSEVARIVGGEAWRDRMAEVRKRLWDLVDAGSMHVTQGGEVRTDRHRTTGPIRVRRRPVEGLG